MQTPESEFTLISTDRVFSRIEENLSSFTSTGLLDTEQFYPEVKWLISQFGLAVFEQTDAVLSLTSHSAELPCDFYLLDSAWLCSKSKQADFCGDVNHWQGKAVFFTTTDNQTFLQDQFCPPPNFTGWSVNACNNNAIIDQVTVTEYVKGSPQTVRWDSPVMLKLNTNKKIGRICSPNCCNLFASCPNEISISRRGQYYYLTSDLKDPVIYVKYWKYPVDKETNLPLIPDDPIIERAVESHLTHWLLTKLWTNGEISDVENKIKYWEQRKINDVQAARTYCKTPSFLTMVNLARTTRKRWASYESIMSYHY